MRLLRAVAAIAAITLASLSSVDVSPLGRPEQAFADATPPTTTVPTTDTPATTVLDNPFLPEGANIGDCVSAVPRPECGSKARGGWRQTLVFGTMLVAMVVIGYRIFVSVRRRDRPAGTAS